MQLRSIKFLVAAVAIASVAGSVFWLFSKHSPKTDRPPIATASSTPSPKPALSSILKTDRVVTGLPVEELKRLVEPTQKGELGTKIAALQELSEHSTRDALTALEALERTYREKLLTSGQNSEGPPPELEALWMTSRRFADQNQVYENTLRLLKETDFNSDPNTATLQVLYAAQTLSRAGSDPRKTLKDLNGLKSRLGPDLYQIAIRELELHSNRRIRAR